MNEPKRSRRGKKSIDKRERGSYALLNIAEEEHESNNDGSSPFNRLVDNDEERKSDYDSENEFRSSNLRKSSVNRNQPLFTSTSRRFCSSLHKHFKLKTKRLCYCRPRLKRKKLSFKCLFLLLLSNVCLGLYGFHLFVYFSRVAMTSQIIKVILVVALSFFQECHGIPKYLNETKFPGIQLHITQKGFDYACHVGTDITLEQLKSRHIPPQSGRSGDLTYEFTNLRIVSIDAPEVELPLLKGKGLDLRLTGLGLHIRGDWALHFKKGIFSISEHGTFKASVYGADLESKVAVLRDPSQPGRPSVRSLGCHSSVRDVSISIHGGSLAWIVNLFHDAIAARIRDELPSIICAETNDAIDVQLNRALKRLHLEADILVPVPGKEGVHLDVDYRLLAPPQVNRKSVDLNLKGEIYGHPQHQEVPFEPPKVDTSTAVKERMVNLHLSDYVFNSGFYSAYKTGQANFWISRSALPKENRDFLNTTCNFSIIQMKGCVGTVVPSVAKLFPNQSVIINVFLASAPKMKITNTTVELIADIQIRWFASDFNQSEAIVGNLTRATSRHASSSKKDRPEWEWPGGAAPRVAGGSGGGDLGSTRSGGGGRGRGAAPRYLFTTNHTLTVAALPFVSEEKLKIRFQSVDVSLAVADAAISMKGFHSTIFKFLLGIISNHVVLPRLNQLGLKGLVLPSFDGISFYNEKVVLQKDALLVGCDLKYQPN